MPLHFIAFFFRKHLFGFQLTHNEITRAVVRIENADPVCAETGFFSILGLLFFSFFFFLVSFCCYLLSKINNHIVLSRYSLSVDYLLTLCCYYLQYEFCTIIYCFLPIEVSILVLCILGKYSHAVH